MQKLVFTNGGGNTIDLTSGNFGITNWEGLSGVDLNIQTQQVPFQDGGVFLDALMEQREISVTVAIQDNNDLSARYERKRQLISALNPKLGEGVLVYTNDYLSRQIKAVPQLPIFENKNSNDAGTLKANVTFSCPSPYWEDLEETSINIQEYSKIENNGDVPVQVKIDIQAGANNTTIINQTTEKMIQLNGTFQDEVIVNTNIGQKSAETRSLEFVWLSGGDFNSLASDGEELLYNGTQNLLINRYTNTVQNVPKVENVIFSNDKYIGSVGTTIYISEDGINWETYPCQVSQYAHNILCARYLNGEYFATFEDYQIYKSSDLVNWTQVFTEIPPVVSRPIFFIDYLNNKYIAGSIGGRILISDNGTDWTVYDNNITNIQGAVRKIIFQNGKYYTAIGQIYSSNDGISWTQITNFSGFAFSDIIYANNLFVAVGSKGNIYTSIDGENWIKRESGTETTIRCIIYAGSFYICGESGLMGRSWNGKTWNIETKGIDRSLSKTIKAKGKLYATTDNYNDIWVTENGIDWELKYQSQEYYSYFGDFIYADNKFVLIQGQNVVISEDGDNWEEITNVFTYSTSIKITYSNKTKLFYMVRGGTSLYTSQDGRIWTEIQNAFEYNMRNILYVEENDVFIATGNNGTYISEDGATWQQVSSIGTGAIIYGQGIYVVKSSSTQIIISTDLIEWEVITTPQISTIHFAENLFFGLARGVAYISSDARNWREIGTDTYSYTNTVLYYKGKYLSFGDAGVVMQSREKDVQNIINRLTPESDMTFNLIQGRNDILVIDDNNRAIQITFRQKYIGV
jgi:predicted phage tail component-like protein